MEAIQIRPFRFPEDYPAARALWETAGPGIHLGRSDSPAEIEKKFQRDPDLFLVAEAAGRMVGTVIGGFDGRRGLVYHLAVAADSRTHGVGGRLMDELERRLKAKGCLKVYLMVVEDNENALRFYQRRGWSPMPSILTLAKELD